MTVRGRSTGAEADGPGPSHSTQTLGTPNSHNNLGKEECSWRTHFLTGDNAAETQCGAGLKADIQTNRTERRAQKLTFA